MLPGSRVFTDDDIVAVVGEALSVFGRIVDEYDPPADLRNTVFTNCLHMVGQRAVPENANTILQGLPRIKGH